MKTSLLLSCLISATPAVALAADTVTTVPVHFSKGASSTTVKGSFKGYDTVLYTLLAFHPPRKRKLKERAQPR